MTWASEIKACADQARQLADTQEAATARNLGSKDFETPLFRPRSNDESIRGAQTTTNDTRAPHRPPEQQRGWAESLSCELALARRDIELLQRLEQEHDRAERLAESVDAARLEIESQTAFAAKAIEEASRLKESSRPNQAADSGAAELQEERERSVRLAKDLAAARREVETQTALATQAGEEVFRLKQAGDIGAAELAELRKAIQQERERSTQLEQDLAAARHDLESQAALAAKASEELSQRSQAAEASAADLRQLMAKERERAETLEQDRSLTQSAVYAYQAQTALVANANADASVLKASGEPGVAELQNTLQQQQDRIDQLEQALATSRRDIDAQTALAAKSSDEVARLTQAAEAGAAEQKRSMQKEHDRAEALQQDLSTARSKVYAYEAEAAKASEEAALLKQTEASDRANLRKSQQREREQADQLALDLAKASRDSAAETERASKASEEMGRSKQAGERDSAELHGLLLRERAGGAGRDLASARHDSGELVTENAPPASHSATSRQAAREEPPAAPVGLIQMQPVKKGKDKPVQQVQHQTAAASSQVDAPVNPNEGVQAAKLIARASMLLKQGDIGSARVVLERALEIGSAQASFELAQTYDPLILPYLGTYGTQGDVAKARTLYARAEAGGIKEAKARFEALRQ